jgi:glutathione S-transferase
MKLYYDETLNARKPCVLARHLGLPVEYRRVRLARGEHRTPDFLALNPNGRVPVLQDQDLVLWEANAILCHLSIAAGSDLWPAQPRQQVEVHRWLSWDAAHFTQHGSTLYFEHVIKPALGLGPTDAQAVEGARAQFAAAAAVLEAHLQDRDFALGDRLSVADFALSAALPWAEPAQLPLEDFPAIGRWRARLQALPAWADPFPAMAS